MKFNLIPSREPVIIPKRKSLTKAQKLRLMIEYPVCWVCKERLGAYEDVEFDHIIAREISGDDSEANQRPIHTKCHRNIKCKDDYKIIAKVKRLSKPKKAKGKIKGKIPSRPFPKRRKSDGR